MKTKHTPGPWTALQASITTVGVPGRGAVAQIRETPCARGLYLTSEIAMANAHLIAAAPDLLAALELAQRIIFQTCAVKASSPEYGIICAAIAKAKGESPK